MYTSDIPNKDALSLDKFIARCDNIRCNNQTKEKEAAFEAIYNMFGDRVLIFERVVNLGLHFAEIFNINQCTDFHWVIC